MQSIVNALLRIDICNVAPEIKITIVVNYNELKDNRAVALVKTVGEIEKLFGKWERFNHEAVLLMITQVPS